MVKYFIGLRQYTGTELPVFLEAKNLKPLITKDMEPVLTPIDFRTPRGASAEGFDAEILPTICDIYLQAREDGLLTPQQAVVAKQCEILVRGFARIGIIALVDEATGYQDVRARKALEEILDKFIAEELRKWAKTFPDEFYKEIFRLKNWPYAPWSVRRPGVIGRYTNDIVYERLAPGVLNELRRKNPVSPKGHRKARHHQWLTEDIGHPRLREHIAAVIALMRASNNWTQFHRMLQRAFPRYGTNLEFPFVDADEPRVH
tara:strand:- start:267 stop:1046 length:780 start_codon:yes stop_codon:yes gene_type:complete